MTIDTQQPSFGTYLKVRTFLTLLHMHSVTHVPQPLHYVTFLPMISQSFPTLYLSFFSFTSPNRPHFLFNTGFIIHPKRKDEVCSPLHCSIVPVSLLLYVSTTVAALLHCSALLLTPTLRSFLLIFF